MTKVLLVNAGNTTALSEQPPIGLMSIAAYLQSKEIEVKICDRPKGDNISTDIISFKPDIVGISATTPTINDAYLCAKITKDLGIYTVMGGHHVSALPEEAIQHCNAVVIGEGELKLLELINTKANGIFDGIPIENLDDLPMPAYDLVDMEYYATAIRRVNMSIISFAHEHSRIACILTSRGCPFSCIYCYNSIRRSKIRKRSPENVIKEIKLLQDKYRIDTICFLEDDLFIDHKRLNKICELMDTNNVKVLWAGNSRVSDVDESILINAYNHGCIQIAFGVESNSQRILDLLDKKATIEQAQKAVELVDKTGIVVQANFMIGNPTETKEEMYESMKFFINNNIDGGIGISITTPLPGTKLWDMYNKSNCDYDKLSYGNCNINLSNVDDCTFNKIVKIIRLKSYNCFIIRKGSRRNKLIKLMNKLNIDIK
jgi:anaerobic magnesium-protoporphyrin IX monomethyl ester cyclase